MSWSIDKARFYFTHCMTGTLKMKIQFYCWLCYQKMAQWLKWPNSNARLPHRVQQSGLSNANKFKMLWMLLYKDFLNFKTVSWASIQELPKSIAYLFLVRVYLLHKKVEPWVMYPLYPPMYLAPSDFNMLLHGAFCWVLYLWVLQHLVSLQSTFPPLPPILHVKLPENRDDS